MLESTKTIISLKLVNHYGHNMYFSRSVSWTSWLNTGFEFSVFLLLLDWLLSKATGHTLFCDLHITEERRDRFIPIPRVVNIMNSTRPLSPQSDPQSVT